MATDKVHLIATTAIAIVTVALGAGESVAAGPAPAVEARNASTNTAPTGEVSEVIVTATRREQNLQNVPVAVTAITSDDLVKLHVQTLQDLQFSVPNLVFGGESSSRRPDIALRGIDSATRVPGFEGAIGFFVDGVYEPFPDQWNNPVQDVDRVEILYGPQDTLFGKNTVAGAISITTKKPTAEFGGFASAEYGNYDYYQFRGAVNIPLVKDMLYLRASGLFGRRDGYVTNVYDGHKFDDLNQQGGRLALLYTPTSNLRIDLSADIFDDHSAEVQSETVGDKYSVPDPRSVNFNTDPKTSRTLANLNLTAEYTFSNGGKLTSTSAYGHTRAHYHTDEDGNPADHWVTDIYDRTTNFSQEFRYASPTGGRFDYLAGIYYLYTRWAQPGSLQTLPDDPYNSPGGLGFLKSDGTLDYSDSASKLVFSNSYAAYANGTFHFNDRLSLTGGVRVLHDDKNLRYPGQINFGAGFLNLCRLGALIGAPGCLIPGGAYPNEPAYQDGLSNTAATGSGSLNFQATHDLLFYAKIANGYKSGGWNTDLTHSSPPGKFAPENVTYYEIGAKTEFLNRHIRLNGDLFYEDYQNKQETVFVNITEGFRISNAASATIKGFEVSGTAVYGGFTLNGGVGYLDPTYNDFQCTQTVNCRGQQLVFAAKTTANGTLEYAHAIGNLGRLAVQAQITYRDRIFLAVPNDPASSVPGYTLLNGRVAFTLNDGKTEIYAFGKNLTDKLYKISQFPGSPSYPGYGATASILYGEPRFYGVGVSRSF